MTTLQGIIIILLLIAFISLSYYIHDKRSSKKYIKSYQWYVKILK